MSATKVQLIGGQFQDAEGNLLINGSLEMYLSQDCSVPGVASVCSGIAVRIQLDSTASVASSSSSPPATNQFIWGNDVLLPTNNFYRVTGYTAEGQPAWGPNNQQVIGDSPFDVGTWIPNQIYSWTPPTVTTELEVNGTPTSDQSVLNLTAGSNITITDEGNGEVVIASTGGSSTQLGRFLWSSGSNECGYSTQTMSDGSISVTNVPNPGNSLVQVFVLNNPISIEVSSVTMQFTSATGATVTTRIGLYTADGNTKLIDVGFPPGSTGVVTETFTPVSLPAGIYVFAQTCVDSNTSHSFPAVGVIAWDTNSSQDMVTVAWTTGPSSLRAGNSSNYASPSALPATLGTIVTDSSGINLTVALFQ